MNQETEYYFGCAMFEKKQDGETYYFERKVPGTHIQFTIRTHMAHHWELRINGGRIQCADTFTPETLKHMLIGFGFLKANPLSFLHSVTATHS